MSADWTIVPFKGYYKFYRDTLSTYMLMYETAPSQQLTLSSHQADLMSELTAQRQLMM